MAEPLLYPNCQQPILAATDFHLAWLTCPRCMEVVPNPMPEAPAPGPTPPEKQTDVTIPHRSVPEGAPAETCSRCGKPAQAQWLFCPHCEQALRSPVIGRGDARLRPDARRSGRRVVLTVLGGAGLLFTLFTTTLTLTDGNPVPLVVLLTALFGVIGLSTLVTLIRNQGDLTAGGFGHAVAATLTAVGALVFLGGVLVLAACILAFAVSVVWGHRY
jgi:hypothetical protein